MANNQRREISLEALERALESMDSGPQLQKEAEDYLNSGPFERAAARRRAQVSPRPRSTTLEAVGEAMVPQTPLDVGLMALGGPMGRAAKTGAVGLGALLTSDEAQAGPLTKLLKGIRAYHASPHEFDRFDMSKIGTGEGAQVYGHGLYFAEKEDVAKNYREAFQRREKVAIKGKEIPGRPPQGQSSEATELLRNLGLGIAEYARDLNSTGYVADYAKKGLDMYTDRARKYLDTIPRGAGNEHTRDLRDMIDYYENVVKSASPRDITTLKGPSHMYEVNIRADPERLLDWDKPIRKQSQQIQEAIASRQYGYYAPNMATGKDIYYNAGPQSLLDMDIPGLRYLDQFSRGKEKGTHNYVMFRDDIIDILRKYGIAGLGALPAVRSIADINKPLPEEEEARRRINERGR